MLLVRTIILVLLTTTSAMLFAEPRSKPTGKAEDATQMVEPAESDEEPNRELLGDVSLTSTPENKIWRFAAGTGLVWSIRKDYGARSFKRFEPEILGFYYSKLPSPNLWLRHGARLGYSSDQPQMPQSVRMEETDLKLSVDEAILFSSIVTPSLAFGFGLDWREVAPKRKNPVASSDPRLKNRDQFFWYYVQAGVGIPAIGGEYLIEPIVRWQHLPIDQRTKWAFGFELSKAW